MTACALVIPCFNEERRLDADRLVALAEGVELHLVDDGSTDGTLAVLHRIQARLPARVRVVALEKNGGKGEAVRRGLLDALDGGAAIVGYADADLATPPSELLRLRDHALQGPAVTVGSRVLLMGVQIERHLSRHLLGRAFATFAAGILQMNFYDTQCGAKFLRDTPALRAALSRPFRSRWAFDVELLGRLRIGTPEVPGLPLTEFREVPLEQWVDVPDSKLRFHGMAKTLADLSRIAVDLAAQRERVRDRKA